MYRGLAVCSGKGGVIPFFWLIQQLPREFLRNTVRQRYHSGEWSWGACKVIRSNRYLFLGSGDGHHYLFGVLGDRTNYIRQIE